MKHLKQVIGEGSNDSISKVELLVGTILFSILGLSVLQDILNPILLYDRQAVLGGQLWRLVSANFVHTNFYHALMNGVGLLFTYAIFKYSISEKHWFLSIAVFVVSVTCFLLLLSPSTLWYMGFSGILHALLAFGFASNVYQKQLVHLLPLSLLTVKVLLEQVDVLNQDRLEGIIGAAVLVDSHLYGYISGVLLASTLYLKQRVKLFA